MKLSTLFTVTASVGLLISQNVSGAPMLLRSLEKLKDMEMESQAYIPMMPLTRENPRRSHEVLQILAQQSLEDPDIIHRKIHGRKHMAEIAGKQIVSAAERSKSQENIFEKTQISEAQSSSPVTSLYLGRGLRSYSHASFLKAL